MATFAPVRSVFHPAIPQSMKDLGIPESLVLDLVLRRMLIEGYSNLGGLSRSLRISVPIIDIVFKHIDEAGVVHVELVGACGTCPVSTMTLKAGVERIIMDRVPGITEVVAD